MPSQLTGGEEAESSMRSFVISSSATPINESHFKESVRICPDPY